MCVIVDTNVAALVLADVPGRAGFEPLHVALFGTKQPSATLAYGGSRMLDELARNRDVIAKVQALKRAGRARQLSGDAVDKRAEALINSKQLTSDDPHVVAVALVGNVRLVATSDEALRDDLRNRAIIEPVAAIYHGDVAKLSRNERRKRVKLIREHCTTATTPKSPSKPKPAPKRKPAKKAATSTTQPSTKAKKKKQRRARQK